MRTKLFLLLLTILLIVPQAYAQLVKNIEVTQAGTLSTLVGTDKTLVTDLTLTGAINDADFTTIKQMTVLKNLDMANVKIVNNTIPANAFENRVFTKVVLPTNLEKISSCAFLRATLTEKLALPSSLLIIGNDAFNLMKVPSVDLSKCVLLEEIGYHAFMNISLVDNVLDLSECSKFVHNTVIGQTGAFSHYQGSVILPRDMKVIPIFAFADFKGKVTFPTGLETIGGCAFLRANLSEKVTLPSSLRIIANDAFNASIVPSIDFHLCTALEEIGYHAFMNISLVDNVLDLSDCSKFVRNTVTGQVGAFSHYQGSVILPRDMKAIPIFAFADFKGKVTFPAGLETISGCAFLRANLSEKVTLPSTLRIIANDAFNTSVIPSIDFHLCTALEEIGYHAFMNISLIDNVLDFSDNQKLIRFGVINNTGAFTDYQGHVILPRNLVNLPDWTFARFKGTIDFPPVLTTISHAAFNGATFPSGLTLPASLKVIGWDAFSGVTIPSFDFSQCPNLEEIGPAAFVLPKLTNNVLDFSKNLKLTRFGILNNNTGAFTGYEGHVILPRNLVTLLDWTFARFKGTIDFSPVLTTISHAAFQGATFPSGLTLPASLKVIGWDAFSGVTIPSFDFSQCPNLEEVGPTAFVSPKLTTNVLDFSQNLKLTRFTPINNNTGTFSGYEGRVILPRNLVTLPDWTFARFKGTIDFSPVLTTISHAAFQGATFPSGLTLPASLKVIGWDAFSGVTIPSFDFSQCPNLEEVGPAAFVLPKLTNNVLDFSKNLKLTRFGILNNNTGAFTGYEGHVILPSNLVTLPDWTFARFKGTIDFSPVLKTIGSKVFDTAIIKEICLPSTLKTIETNAFNGCTQLEKIVSNSTSPASLGTTVFTGVNKTTCKLQIPQTSFALYQVTSQWKDFLVMENITKQEETTPDEAAVTSINISYNQNFVRTITYQTDQRDKNKSIDQIQYFDGLGRPMETVQRAINPDKKDLVSYQEYDAFGRESKAWLPSVSNGGGAFIALPSVQTNANATYQDSAYARPVYEASPLNRIVEQYGPGKEWYNDAKPVKTEYLTNLLSGDANLTCTIYSVSGTRDNPVLNKGLNYATGQLYVTKAINEEGSVSYEFKDKLGQVVLTRQLNDTEKLDTYYVYDDFGNLCFVLPPLMNGAIDEANRDLYAYCYKYDSRNRCFEKKLPGAAPIRYVYDRADHLVLTQDGEQRLKNEWLFTVTDALERVVVSGTCRNVVADVTSYLKDVVVSARFNAANSANKYYDISGMALTGSVILTANYYDNYDFNTKEDFTKLAYRAENGYGTLHLNNQGRLTGSITALLDGSGKYLYTALYYDRRGRVIQTQSTNHLGGIERECVAYNFTNQPTAKLHIHTGKDNADNTKQTELYSYGYDHGGRLSKTEHSLNGAAAVVLAENGYDAVGRLKNSKQAGNTALNTSYSYNVRSWTSQINNVQFTEALSYTLSGNIKAMSWKQAGDTKNRSYSFTYDRLSRLTNALYTGIADIAKEDYSSSYSYDGQGNMKTLTRRGMLDSGVTGLIDDLSMEHKGNQLVRTNQKATAILEASHPHFMSYTTQTGDLYTYNANGAMVTDLTKGLTMCYNSQNLPLTIEINNTSTQAKNIYTYTATGSKLRVVYKEAPVRQQQPLRGATLDESSMIEIKATDYVANKIYEDDQLKMILLDNGYYDYTDKKYYFYVKDHLGNNRLVVDAAASIVQSNQYYPFGMSFAEGTGQDKQPFKYNGKEFDSMHNLNLYDYLARQYDPIVPHLPTPDPHSESYYSWSPYVYAGNNPILNIDPTGEDYWSTNDPNEIERFMNAQKLNPYSFNSETFDYSSWNHVSNDAFKAGLTFDDTKGVFNFTHAVFEKSSEASGGIAIGIATTSFNAVPGFGHGSATVTDHKMGATRMTQDKGLEPLYLEFGLVGATSSGWAIAGRLARTLWNTMTGSSNTTLTIDASKSGFAFKGGKQSTRDASIKQYPTTFQRWYHKFYKDGKVDATREELKELYKEWTNMGSPTVK